MVNSLYYGFWDYWELRHKVTFDGVNKLILVNDGEISLDVQIDIYSDWKEWLLLENNLKYLQAFSTVGGEPTVLSQSLDVTYFLVNGWKLKPYSGQYNLDIIGNLFDIDGGDIKVSADVISNEPNNITVNLNTSVIVRQISSTSGNSNVTASLVENESQALFDISGSVVRIENILSSPLTSSLIPTQATQLTNIETKVSEIWQLHGLDILNPLNVTQNQRTFAGISQSISTTGTGSLQDTTLTRL